MEKIAVDIDKKKDVLNELFGAVKFRRSARKIMGEAREDLESQWLK